MIVVTIAEMLVQTIQVIKKYTLVIIFTSKLSGLQNLHPLLTFGWIYVATITRLANIMNDDASEKQKEKKLIEPAMTTDNTTMNTLKSERKTRNITE